MIVNKNNDNYLIVEQRSFKFLRKDVVELFNEENTKKLIENIKKIDKKFKEYCFYGDLYKLSNEKKSVLSLKGFNFKNGEDIVVHICSLSRNEIIFFNI